MSALPPPLPILSTFLRRFRSALPVALLTLAAGSAGTASAIEFQSLRESAILYDSPSLQGQRVSILHPGTPVEIIVSDPNWVKVREPGGSLNWVERRVLSNTRTVLVTVPRASIRQAARADAPLSFEAVRNVVLNLVSPPELGWARVRHADGSEGFIRVSEIWGL